MHKFNVISKLVRKNSEEKVEHAIFGQYTNHTWLAFLCFLTIYYFSLSFIRIIGLKIWMIIFVIIFLLYFIYLVTRNVGLGITKNRFIYVVLRHFGYKEKKVFEIPYDKIKYIDVKKVFFNIFVKVSFISEVGKLEKIKFNFRTSLVGSENFRNDSKAIYNKLVEVQKIVDKGDF